MKHRSQWILNAGKKSTEDHYSNGVILCHRTAQWRVKGYHLDQPPEFTLRPVPGGDGKCDSIDVLHADHPLELIHIRDSDIIRGDASQIREVESGQARLLHRWTWDFWTEPA